MAVNREQVLQSAEKLLAKGKLDQALKEYLRVLEDNPKDISTLNKVGDLYVRMNRPGDSIPYFTRIADFYSKDGFFLKAIAIFKKINKIDPAQLEVYDKLADLYHKQGLVQDARSQYQVLADHYQKNNRLPDAIEVYKKMAAIDTNDMRIQVRLADLYRSAHQKDQAVMQYGLIGNMLLKRGAHDEAAQVFQKALELSPDDVESQKNLVRSLLAQNNTDAAMAVLKAAPRTADSLALFAEAQLEMGQRAEAIRTAEQALQLDADAEAPRRLPAQPARSRRARTTGPWPRSPRPWTRPSGAEGRRTPPSSSSRSSRPIPHHVGDSRAAREGARGRGQPARAGQGARRPRRGGREETGPGERARPLPARPRGQSLQRRGGQRELQDIGPARRHRPLRPLPPLRRRRRRPGDPAGGGPAGVPGVRDRSRGLRIGPRSSAQGAVARVRARGGEAGGPRHRLRPARSGGSAVGSASAPPRLPSTSSSSRR